MPQSGSPWQLYFADLKWSARTLWSSPSLALVTVGLFAVFDLSVRRAIRPPGVAGLLTLAVEVFLIGFVGAQRVWFLRKLRGVGFYAREMWTLPWKFFGRFLCLSLLGSLVAAPLLIALVIIDPVHRATTTSSTQVPRSFTIVVLVGTLLFDVALTFIVPALALSVRSVRASIRLGWCVTRRLWPTNGWYLFAPGITLVALTALLPASVISTTVYLCVGIFSALLSLWFKGATVAFYVRSFPQMPVDGSAFA